MPDSTNTNRREDDAFEDGLLEAGQGLPSRGEVPAMGARRRPPVRLDFLLDGVTDSNRHDEVDAAPPKGREVW